MLPPPRARLGHPDPQQRHIGLSPAPWHAAPTIPQVVCKLYSGCVKPKTHYMLHCCQQLRAIGANVSCFAPERAHRWPHTIGSFAFKNMCHTMTSRMVANVLDEAKAMCTFNACVVGPAMPKYWRNHGDLFQAYFRKLGAQAASSARTHVGSVHAGDLLALRCPSGDVAIAWCLACCGGGDHVALVVSQLAPERGARYRASPSGAAGVVQANAVLARLVYYNDCDVAHVFVPITLR